MPVLTAEQTSSIAKDFLSFAQALGNYRLKNWATLHIAEKQTLGNFQWSLLNTSEDLYALSTDIELDEVQTALIDLNRLSEKVQTTLAVLGSVEKAIELATAIVTLGAALTSRSRTAFTSALESALSLVHIN